MNTNTHHILDSIEAHLRVTLALAERVGLDEIRMSTGRARTLLAQISAAKKPAKVANREPAYFRHLDRVMA